MPYQRRRRARPPVRIHQRQGKRGAFRRCSPRTPLSRWRQLRHQHQRALGRFASRQHRPELYRRRACSPARRGSAVAEEQELEQVPWRRHSTARQALHLPVPVPMRRSL